VSFQIYTKRLRGLFAVAALAFVSFLFAGNSWLSHLGISSLIIAIILGIVIGNIIHLPSTFTPGIQYAAKQLLRTAIILYGFRVSLQEIHAIGVYALLIDTTIVTSTLFIGYQIGTRLLKLDRHLALLISCGAAICGAAAVLAVEDIIKSEPYKAAIAVGTVVLFGTISMFLYPVLQRAGMLGLSNAQFGIFAGASVHEVAQALVTGSSISQQIGQTAVVVKMVRVLLLIPVLLFLSFWNPSAATDRRKKLMVPWFAVGFLLVICFNSLHLVPQSIVKSINAFDMLLLTMAMGAIGLETKFSKIKKVGLNPLYLAALLFAWLLCFAALTVRFATI
jgi:uncharacterized integral membrane protein (TIGR00698 family)